MKKLLSIVLTIALVAGLFVTVNSIKADTTTINSTPAAGSTVNLLSGRVYNYCANWNWGAVDSYYRSGGTDYYPTALTVSWDAVNDATSYELIIGTKSDLQDAAVYNVTGTSKSIDDLYTGCDYYYQVTTEVSGQQYSTGIINIKTANLPRTLNVGKVHNTRDFGGCYTKDCMHRVKQGVLYRGANLDKISDAGKDKMINTYGIKTDFDLRQPEKIPETPPLGDGVKFINYSSPQYLDKPDYSRAGVGYGISNPSNFETLKNEFLVLADASNYPIYLHCNIGRDRTGTICSLLGGLLGMYEEDIYKDYELSFFDNQCNGSGSGELGGKKPSQWEVKRIGIMLDYIRDYFPADTLQGSVEKYMKEKLELTDNDLNNIKSNLLEELPAPVTSVPWPSTTPRPTTTTATTTTKTTTTAPTTVVPTTITPTQESTVVPTKQPITTTKKTTVKPTTTVKRPGKAKISKAKYKKKRKIYIKLKKVAGANGYNIRYSDSKKFDGYYDKYTKKKKITLKKLDKHTKYYIKVRAYKKTTGGKLFGKWSKVKKVKVKK